MHYLPSSCYEDKSGLRDLSKKALGMLKCLNKVNVEKTDYVSMSRLAFDDVLL